MVKKVVFIALILLSFSQSPIVQADKLNGEAKLVVLKDVGNEEQPDLPELPDTGEEPELPGTSAPPLANLGDVNGYTYACIGLVMVIIAMLLLLLRKKQDKEEDTKRSVQL